MLDGLAVVCSPLRGGMWSIAGWKVIDVPDCAVSGMYCGTAVQYAGYHKVWDTSAVFAMPWIRKARNMYRGRYINPCVYLDRTVILAALKA